MDRATFERHVAEALASIPRRFRDAMQNIAIVVEDEPSQALLEEMEIDPPDTLLGLYQGTPLTERHWGHGNTLPDRISIYQRPIEQGGKDAGRIEAREAHPIHGPVGADERRRLKVADQAVVLDSRVVGHLRLRL